MARFAALFTSDPALVRCELLRVRDQVALDEPGFVLGVGAHQEEVVLHRHYGVGVPRTEVWQVPDTAAVVLHAAALPFGQGLEHAAQPFRFRQWLFAQVGEVDQPGRVRERLFEELPEHLQRWVRGASLGEVLFGVFLSELRALGRTDDPDLAAVVVAEVLSRTARVVEQASAEVGGTQRAHQALVATNGRVLAGARRGAQPLSYALLEGQAACERCGLTGARGEPEQLVRDHLRRRSVVLATTPLRAESWAAVPDGGAAALDPSLTVKLV